MDVKGGVCVRKELERVSNGRHRGWVCITEKMGCHMDIIGGGCA